MKQGFLVVLMMISTGCSTSAPSSIATTALVETSTESKVSVIQMLTPRAAHSATRLQDGRVLIVGGFRNDEEIVKDNEIFDSRLGQFQPVGRLQNPRVGHTATLLNDGRVLIVGGWSNGRRMDSAEIFDPKINGFQMIAQLSSPRADHTATLLADGRVLIVGGSKARNMLQPAAEIFDPTTGQFRLTGSLKKARSGHTATLLANQKVLIVGGTIDAEAVTASAELYDPKSETFEKTGDLAVRRRKHAAVLLSNNQVMIIGGTDERDWNNPYGTTEIYSSESEGFKSGPALQETRFKLQDAVLKLPSGNALIAGGDAIIEIFDVRANRFLPTTKLDKDYFFSTATLLDNGSVLIAGGYDRGIQVTQQAWLYR